MATTRAILNTRNTLWELLRSAFRTSGARSFPLWTTVNFSDYVPYQVKRDRRSKHAKRSDVEEVAKLISLINERLTRLLIVLARDPRSWAERLERYAAKKMKEKYINFMIEAMADAVYSSNANEMAGLSHKDTDEICKVIFFYGRHHFRGHMSHQYQRYAAFLNKFRGIREPSARQVNQAYFETVQHAVAFKFIVERNLVWDGALTENMIKTTHENLMNHIDSPDGYPPMLPGQYRKHNVFAGSTAFTHHTRVPEEMWIFLTNTNDDVNRCERIRVMDPFFLAAGICQDFIMIHPFADGNGRMGRLLLNLYLLKYAGVVISLGDAKSRKTYMTIAQMTGDPEQEDARSYLARFVTVRALDQLEALDLELRPTRHFWTVVSTGVNAVGEAWSGVKGLFRRCWQRL